MQNRVLLLLQKKIMRLIQIMTTFSRWTKSRMKFQRMIAGAGGGRGRKTTVNGRFSLVKRPR
jgi:hypothetical protein